MLGNHLWQSTVIAVVAGLLTLIFRNNSAHMRHCLWLTASIKFLLPFSLLVLLGSQFSAHTASVSATSAHAALQWSAFMEMMAQPLSGSAPSAEHLISAPIPVRPSFPLESTLLVIWICGTGVVLCVSLI